MTKVTYGGMLETCRRPSKLSEAERFELACLAYDAIMSGGSIIHNASVDLRTHRAEVARKGAVLISHSDFLGRHRRVRR